MQGIELDYPRDRLLGKSAFTLQQLAASFYSIASKNFSQYPRSPLKYLNGRRTSPHADLGTRRGGGDLRPARRGHLACLRPSFGLASAPYSGAPRARSWPHGRRLCARHRQAWRGYGHKRPRRNQHRHAPLRCLYGLCADRGDHRAGALPGYRHRCLPRMRHHRHFIGYHQAQFSGYRSGRHPSDHPRRFPYRHHRTPWAGARRHPQRHHRP